VVRRLCRETAFLSEAIKEFGDLIQPIRIKQQRRRIFKLNFVLSLSAIVSQIGCNGGMRAIRKADDEVRLGAIAADANDLGLLTVIGVGRMFNRASFIVSATLHCTIWCTALSGSISDI
jgi:hypothetical protein